jgi:transcriptional regulator with XRE-family HTH domain
MENKELIGRNIRSIRLQLGMKQKELADSLNISYGYLSEVESGKKSPGLEVVGNLLQKYKVNPTFLLTGQGDYFLTTGEGKGKPGDRKEKAKEGDVYNEAVAEMFWYFENIPAVGFAVLEFFKHYLHTKKDMIDAEIKRIKEKNPGEEIPGR